MLFFYFLAFSSIYKINQFIFLTSKDHGFYAAIRCGFTLYNESNFRKHATDPHLNILILNQPHLYHIANLVRALSSAQFSVLPTVILQGKYRETQILPLQYGYHRNHKPYSSVLPVLQGHSPPADYPSFILNFQDTLAVFIWTPC